MSGVASRLSGFAICLCLGFGLTFLLVAARAVPQALRLNQPLPTRNLEQPISDFFRQIGLAGHVRVLQASPLQVVVTVACDAPSREALARQLHTFYGIQPGLGEQLLVLQGPVPFHWEDHPRGALLIWWMGNGLILVGCLAAVRRRFSLGLAGRLLGSAGKSLPWLFGLALVPIALAPLSSGGGAALRADLSRLVVAPPLAVAVLERDGSRRALVSLGTDDLSSLRPLVSQRAAALGFDPARVACLSFQRSYHFPFRWLGGLCLVLGLAGIWRSRRPSPAAPAPVAEPVPPAAQPAQTLGQELDGLHKLTRVDEICLEVGRSLIGLVDPRQGAPLLERVTFLRRHVAGQFGYVVPAVLFRDNLALRMDEYALRIHGREVARGRVKPQGLLAFGPEDRLLQLEGERAFEPTYGQEGVWISSQQLEEARKLNLLVLDPVSLIATHMTETFRTHAGELLTFNAAVELLKQPVFTALQAELSYRGIGRVAIWKVLRSLLRQQVSIRDLQRILEGLLEMAEEHTPHESLVEFARLAVRDSIVEEFCGGELGKPPQELVLWRVPAELLEHLGEASSQQAEMMEEITRVSERMKNAGHQPLLLVTPEQRPALQEVIYCVPDTRALSLAEIPDWVQVRFFHS